jgi:hypothetical protein
MLHLVVHNVITGPYRIHATPWSLSVYNWNWSFQDCRTALHKSVPLYTHFDLGIKNIAKSGKDIFRMVRWNNTDCFTQRSQRQKRKTEVVWLRRSLKTGRSPGDELPDCSTLSPKSKLKKKTQVFLTGLYLSHILYDSPFSRNQLLISVNDL